MIGGIDHIIVVVRSLRAAIREFEGAGFTVQPGGRHTSGLSENALVVLPDGAYFELYAFVDLEKPANHPRWATSARGGGLAEFHLITDSIDADSARLRDAGLGYSDPYPLGRVRPDGQECRWRLSASPWPAAPFLPYLIEDETPRELRVPGGDPAIHANGARGIGEVIVAVGDLPAAVAAWEKLLNRALPAPEPLPDLDASGVTFTVGPTRIVLAAPASAASPLRAQIDEQGDSLYRVVVSAAGDGFSGRLTLTDSGNPPIDIQRNS